MARIMSGVQPTGNLHIGNYLGALVNWVRLQSEFDAFFSIVDLHALTQRPDPDALRRAVREVAIGDLNRMTQFKDKSQHQPDNVNTGLFTYPVLQTADIILYRADRVPVGEDQEQHLELARETVRRFNYVYGDTFPEPQVVKSSAPRVMGLDGESKMSKSRNNEIGLFETADETMQKLRGAKTDPARLRKTDKGNPEVCNVFSYHGFFSTEAQRAEIAVGCRTAQLGCVDCKKMLCQNLEAVKGPIRERAAELRSKPAELDEILSAGASKARVEAERTMAMVRDRVGLRGQR